MPKYIVRYGTMRSLGVMSTRNEVEFKRGHEVIVRSDRGMEIGQVLCEATEDSLSHLDQAPNGHIVRKVSDDDLTSINDIDASRRKKLETCQKHIDTLGLDMKLVDVEQLFGRERIVVYYLSEERVDFRELVKLLAGEFQTRVEMKQIGVRDEAKILADYGDCGKPVCCNNHLIKMPPVSMKMAKIQKATLDPTKISGRCGRLKCCLRYEFETYDAIQKSLPKVGAFVLTRNGKARVLNQQIITEQLLVETEDHRRMVIEANEVLTVLDKSEFSPSPPKDSSKGQSSKRGSSRSSSKRGGAGKGPSTKQSSSKSPPAQSTPAKASSEGTPQNTEIGENTGDQPESNESSEKPPTKGNNRNKKRGGGRRRSRRGKKK